VALETAPEAPRAETLARSPTRFAACASYPQKLLDACESVAAGHSPDRGVVFLHFLPADIRQFRPPELGVLLEDAEEVSRLDRYVLPKVPDEEDPGVPGLRNPRERSPHLDRLEARLVDDDDGTAEVSGVCPARQEVVNGGGMGKAVTASAWLLVKPGYGMRTGVDYCVTNRTGWPSRSLTAA
jgi:hypothetical protein